jgi:hypothetical protein
MVRIKRSGAGDDERPWTIKRKCMYGYLEMPQRRRERRDRNIHEYVSQKLPPKTAEKDNRVGIDGTFVEFYKAQ